MAELAAVEKAAAAEKAAAEKAAVERAAERAAVAIGAAAKAGMVKALVAVLRHRLDLHRRRLLLWRLSRSSRTASTAVHCERSVQTTVYCG